MRKTHCLIVDDEPTAREILELHLQHIEDFELVGSCKNATEALTVLNQDHVDLIFLDIQMPGISGITLARSLNQQVKVIFTTAYREYAVEGFDLQAVDYLLKPIALERLLQAVQKYRKEKQPIVLEVPTLNLKDHFFVRSDRKMVKIALNELEYVESLGDYLKLHLSNEIIITRETITELETKLPTEKFMRIHRSFIVSLAHIKSYTKEQVELSKQSLTISRSYQDRVLMRLQE